MLKFWSTLFAKGVRITQERSILPGNYRTSIFHRKSTCLQSISYSTLDLNHSSKQNKVSYKFTKLKEGPELEYFIANSSRPQNSVKERLKRRKTSDEDHPYLTKEMLRGDGLAGRIRFLFLASSCPYLV